MNLSDLVLFIYLLKELPFNINPGYDGQVIDL